MSVLKSKKSLKKAPKVPPPKPINGNYMREADDNKKTPILRKRPLSK
jgi:hypothetical protein